MQHLVFIYDNKPVCYWQYCLFIIRLNKEKYNGDKIPSFIDNDFDQLNLY